MILDRALAAFSVLLLAGFLSIVVWFVKEVDLTIVCVVGVLMCAYDFWRTLRAPDQGGNGGG
ncbi:MAG: hypothetical protein ACR2PM_01530 [Hyphomicrobiales bacterium]